jgi:hypothetical protein
MKKLEKSNERDGDVHILHVKRYVIKTVAV